LFDDPTALPDEISLEPTMTDFYQGEDIALESLDSQLPTETRIPNGYENKPTQVLGDSEHASFLADNQEDELTHSPKVAPLASSAPSDEDDEVIMQSFGRFLLIKRLAYGGMGEIFLARQGGVGGFEKLLVIKRLLPHYRKDQQVVTMFFDEAKIQGLMTDHHIAQIYEMGEVDGQYFIAMEYVHGVSWRDLIQRLKERGERLHPAQAVELAVQVCRGVSYAHNLEASDGQPLSIVHRDINPHNLLASYAGECKIIDFGIAKSAIQEIETEFGTIKGKFAYMSPEQARAEPIDRRSDIFSIGICLYELLTLENPFHRNNVVLSLEAVAKYHPDPIDDGDPALSPLAPIVERCIAKNPDDRFADAHELHDALASLYEHGLLGQAPTSVAERISTLFKERMNAHFELLQSIGSGGMARRGGNKGFSALDEISRSQPSPARVSIPPSLEKSLEMPMQLGSADFEPIVSEEIDVNDTLPPPGLESEEPLFLPDDETRTRTAWQGQQDQSSELPTEFRPRPVAHHDPTYVLADTQPTAPRAAAYSDKKRRPFLRFAAGLCLSFFLVVAGVLTFFAWQADWSPGFEKTPLEKPAAIALAYFDKLTGNEPLPPPELTGPEDRAEPEPKAEDPAEKAEDPAEPGEPKAEDPAEPGEPKAEDPAEPDEPKAEDPAEPKAEEPKPTPEPPPIVAEKPKPKPKPKPKAKRPKKPAATLLGTIRVSGDGSGRTKLTSAKKKSKVRVTAGGYKVTLRVSDEGDGARIRVESEPWAILQIGTSGKGKLPQSFSIKKGANKLLTLKSPKNGQVRLRVSYR
jgi:serine/threonine-protein kinase